MPAPVTDRDRLCDSLPFRVFVPELLRLTLINSPETDKRSGDGEYTLPLPLPLPLPLGDCQKAITQRSMLVRYLLIVSFHGLRGGMYG